MSSIDKQHNQIFHLRFHLCICCRGLDTKKDAYTIKKAKSDVKYYNYVAPPSYITRAVALVSPHVLSCANKATKIVPIEMTRKSI